MSNLCETTMSTSPTADRPTLGARIRGRAWREFRTIVPTTRSGDRFLTWLHFVGTHKRLPSHRRMLFNDRLYHIKTSQDLLDPLRTFTADKEFLKLYVKATVGDEFNVPTLALLRSVQECRDFDFPPRCVVKPTHCSGRAILRVRGEPLDFDLLDEWLNTNYYKLGREVNYRYLEPKIIVEPFVFDDDNPSDYKIFCVDGEPRVIQVDSDRHTHHTRTLFDVAWKPLPYAFRYPLTNPPPSRPANLAHMFELSRKLSSRFDFVRVDLYSDGRRALVGELTHCAENAIGVFTPAGGEVAITGLLFGTAER